MTGLPTPARPADQQHATRSSRTCSNAAGGHRPGHQGGHRQGPDAVHLHQHPRPLPGADAVPEPHRCRADRRRGARRRLRQMFNELRPPKGLGFIGQRPPSTRTRTSCQRDLVYLSRLWQVIVKRIKKLKSPAEIYQESEMVRAPSATTTPPTSTPSGWTRRTPSRPPRSSCRSSCRGTRPHQVLRGKEPLFHKYGVEDEIHRIQQKKVPLPNGGSIVIEQTERWWRST